MVTIDYHIDLAIIYLRYEYRTSVQLYLLRCPPASRMAVSRGLYRMCAHLPRVLSSSTGRPGQPDTDPTLLSVRVRDPALAATDSPPEQMPLQEFLLRHVVFMFRTALRHPGSCGHYFALFAALAKLTNKHDTPQGSPKGSTRCVGVVDGVGPRRVARHPAAHLGPFRVCVCVLWGCARAGVSP